MNISDQDHVSIQVDLGETVRAIDNMRLVVHEGRTHAQNVVSREGEGRSSVSSRGSASAAAVAREYQVRVIMKIKSFDMSNVHPMLKGASQFASIFCWTRLRLSIELYLQSSMDY